MLGVISYVVFRNREIARRDQETISEEIEPTPQIVVPTPTTSTSNLSQTPQTGIETEFTAGMTPVMIFFANPQKSDECNQVFPVIHGVRETLEPTRYALEELFVGPTREEKLQGYSSLLPQNVKIQSIVIQNGTASLDLSPEVENYIGGSCTVSTIRSQINQTLLQFPGVNQVTLSVNGKTDILQP